MSYSQITAAERYTLAALRQVGVCPAAIAQLLGRHRSTIGRELRRNRTAHDGCYRPSVAQWYANGRKARARRNRRLAPADWQLVQDYLWAGWSPEQIAGRLRLEGRLRISHETIYRYVWADKQAGGDLYRYLRQGRRHCRKRYGRADSRGRLRGKRPITARPAAVETRRELGHWEGDTMLGAGQAGPCVLTLVERKTGYVLVGKLRIRRGAEVNRRATQLIRRQPHPVRTITVDNGTEFHAYKALERATAARIYFATPHHAWERGTNENTNGLLRQYLPKGESMAHLTQHDCNRIATTLNRRPRKRLGYRTPEECYVP